MIRLYFDEDTMDQDLVRALKARGMDVTTAFLEDMVGQPDEQHLDIAAQQERVLFSFNRRDFYRIHAQYLLQNKSHAGIILANQQQYSVGELMRRILRLSAELSAQEMMNRLEFLSAWD